MNIEVQIRLLTGKSVGPHRRGTTGTEIELPITSQIRQLLKDWLEDCGVDPANTNKSDVGLVRCYAAGRSWVQKKLVSGVSTSSADNRPFIDLGGFGQNNPTKTDSLNLDDLLDSNDAGDITKYPQKPDHFSKSDNIDDLVVATRVDAAKKEILNLFVDLRKELDKQIKSEISSAVKSIDLVPEIEKTLPELDKRVSQVAVKVIASAADAVIFEAMARRKKIETVASNSDLSLEAEAEEIPLEIDPEISSYVPTLDPDYYFDPYASKVIRAAIKMNENFYAYGDTGCGKTTHIEQICAVLNKGVSRVNPHDGVTREMFLGGMKLIAGETKFVKGSLPRAMELGMIFLVDEFSFLPPNLAAILNPVAEKGGKLYIPETGEWISPAPGFCIFATDNTGGKGDSSGQYVGTEVQNTATLDRFAFCLKMDYLPFDKEQEMLERRFPTVSEAEIINMLKLATDIRKAFSAGELAITLSTRKLIKFFNQRLNGFTFAEALQNTLLSWLDGDDSQLIQTMISRLAIDTTNTNPQPTNTAQLTPVKLEFQTALRNNLKVNAIKILRNCFVGLSLKEAKDLTEAYNDGHISLDQVFEKASAIQNQVL